MSRYSPVAAAIKRRQAAGLCPLCGGPLTSRGRLLSEKEVDRVCLNPTCRKAPPKRLKIRGVKIQ